MGGATARTCAGVSHRARDAPCLDPVAEQGRAGRRRAGAGGPRGGRGAHTQRRGACRFGEGSADAAGGPGALQKHATPSSSTPACSSPTHTMRRTLDGPVCQAHRDEWTSAGPSHAQGAGAPLGPSRLGGAPSDRAPARSAWSRAPGTSMLARSGPRARLSMRCCAIPEHGRVDASLAQGAWAPASLTDSGRRSGRSPLPLSPHTPKETTHRRRMRAGSRATISSVFSSSSCSRSTPLRRIFGVEEWVGGGGRQWAGRRGGRAAAAAPSDCLPLPSLRHTQQTHARPPVGSHHPSAARSNTHR